MKLIQFIFVFCLGMVGVNNSHADDLEQLLQLTEIALETYKAQSNQTFESSIEIETDLALGAYNYDRVREIIDSNDDLIFRDVYQKSVDLIERKTEEAGAAREWLQSCVTNESAGKAHKCAITLSIKALLNAENTQTLDWASKASEIASTVSSADPRYWYMQKQSSDFLLIAFIYDRNIAEAKLQGTEYLNAALRANVKAESFFLINNIAYLARVEIGPEAAIQILEAALPLVPTLHEEGKEILYYSLGRNYLAADNYEQSLHYFSEYKKFKSRPDLERAAVANLALIHASIGDKELAAQLVSEAMEKHDGKLESEIGLIILEAEKKLAIASNDLISALSVDSEIDRIDDLLDERALSANRNRLSKNLQITGERLKRDRDRLEYEAQLSEQQAAASRRQLLLSLTALFFVLAMATWIFRSYKREQKLNAEILVKNDELEETNYQLEGAHDRLQKTFDELQVAHKLALAGQDAKEKFIGVIGHELRTPLNPIINLAGVLEDNCQNTKEKALLTAIKNAGKRLHIIVENMLAISSSDENSKIYVEPIDVVENTTTILREFRTEIETKVAGLKRTNESLNVNVLKSPKLNALQYCNKVIFRSIVRNLFDNALKFTRTGDVVIELRPRPDGSGFIFVIRDTGAGMETSKISDLIEPFQQAEMDLGRAYEGAGLGLTVVQKYCEQLGAKLSIESTVNVGTKITINFPTPAYQVSTGKLLKAA